MRIRGDHESMDLVVDIFVSLSNFALRNLFSSSLSCVTLYEFSESFRFIAL
jgi:hypothetical protein